MKRCVDICEEEKMNSKRQIARELKSDEFTNSCENDALIIAKYDENGRG